MLLQVEEAFSFIVNNRIDTPPSRLGLFIAQHFRAAFKFSRYVAYKVTQFSVCVFAKPILLILSQLDVPMMQLDD